MLKAHQGRTHPSLASCTRRFGHQKYQYCRSPKHQNLLSMGKRSSFKVLALSKTAAVHPDLRTPRCPDPPPRRWSVLNFRGGMARQLRGGTSRRGRTDSRPAPGARRIEPRRWRASSRDSEKSSCGEGSCRRFRFVFLRVVLLQLGFDLIRPAMTDM